MTTDGENPTTAAEAAPELTTPAEFLRTVLAGVERHQAEEQALREAQVELVRLQNELMAGHGDMIRSLLATVADLAARLERIESAIGLAPEWTPETDDEADA